MKANHLLLTSVALFTMAGANAQSIKFQDDVRGNGEINRRVNSRVDRVQVKLTDDRYKSAEISFSGSRSEGIKGRWYEVSRDRYEIDIREAFGDREATGTIVLELNRGKLERLSFEGNTRSESFRGNFAKSSATAGTLDWRGNYRGSGNLSVGRDRSNADEVSIRFNRDGRFTITVAGRRGEINGTYRQERGDVVSLLVTEALDLGDVRGQGKVFLNRDGRSVSRIDLTARSGRETMSLVFRSGAGGDSGGTRGGELPGGVRELVLKNEHGEGRMRRGGNTSAFDTAEIKLNQDGTFWAKVNDRRGDEIRGTWTLTQKLGKTVGMSLKITEAFGDRDARGTGEVKLGSGSSDFALDFNGVFNRENVTINFKNDGRDGNGTASGLRLDRNLVFTRDGSFTEGRDRQNWSRTKLRLNRSGGIEMWLRDDRDLMRGTYLQVRDEEYSFSVSNSSGLVVRGRILLNRGGGSVRRIEFEGSSRDGDFSGRMDVRNSEEVRR